MAISLVILLHGVGSMGSNMAPLASYLGRALPGMAFETPDATEPNDLSDYGHQWFSVRGVTAENRAARVEAVRPAFDALIRRLIAKHGLTDAPEKVAFLGFSQGTIMALDAVASGRWNPGAVAGFSGRLATGDPLMPAPDTRVLLVHGDADTAIPVSESASAFARLQAAGMDVSLTVFPGLGHSVSEAGLDLAIRHLTRPLTGPLIA
ncbi:prolyl oligopeptidase family serine peptidase [Pseudogemmobacter bohemicus]|uniref:prolyl oligopeptidase family serine peptidase n=1 Tax=Pseudogemmobacter bohemicus TaxID=2250708 RepID=UPI000DD477E4|nr:prolyl oligopeptidase family serine peptidase [Pseudogemmobacter bohemicus]